MSLHDDPRRERDAEPPRPQRRRGLPAQPVRAAELRSESARPKSPLPVSETRGPRLSRDPRRDSTRPRLDATSDAATAPDRAKLDARSRNRQRDVVERREPPPPSLPAKEQAPSPPATPAPEELELLARLRAELATLEQEPPWTVLGISQSADAAAAREAFFAASKRYHPHLYARYALPEIKAVVTQLFIAYKRAFTTMTKTGRSPRLRSSDPTNR